MTFYQFAVKAIKFIFTLFNGRPQVIGLDRIPQNKTLIFAATHRSYTDPFFLADILYPRQIAFMAKDSLFKRKWLAKLLSKGQVFPVNREKPAASTMKHAVKILTSQESDLGIFPAGTRHATEIKSGTAFIQKMAKTDIIPIAIQPPIGFWQFITRKKAKIAIGHPIAYDPNLKYTKDDLAQIDQELAQAFETLDAELDPTYVYIPRKQVKA